MAAYESFAEVYDMYMDNVPYDIWCQQLCQLLEDYQVPKGLVAELGCGTGKMTRRLQREGYDMIGIDNAYEMLGIAMAQESENILYLCQDMREFELYGTVAAVVSVCDSINYLTEDGDLEQVIRLANNYLDPGGVFVFDINTRYKYAEILADNTFAETRETGSFIWENEFDEETNINAYALTLYIGDEQTGFQRYMEEHFQRAYTLDEVKQAVANGGMQFLQAIDVDTMGPVCETTERMYIVCKEQGKEMK